jgi:hypothetical protein
LQKLSDKFFCQFIKADGNIPGSASYGHVCGNVHEMYLLQAKNKKRRKLL